MCAVIKHVLTVAALAVASTVLATGTASAAPPPTADDDPATVTPTLSTVCNSMVLNRRLCPPGTVERIGIEQQDA
jgi:hypothetical protein